MQIRLTTLYYAFDAMDNLLTLNAMEKVYRARMSNGFSKALAQRVYIKCWRGSMSTLLKPWPLLHILTETLTNLFYSR